MEIFLAWFVFSIIVGFIGSGKTIGFFLSFILSLFFSPIIGLIIVAFSESKATKELREELKKQNEFIRLQQQPVTIEDQKAIAEKKVFDAETASSDKFTGCLIFAAVVLFFLIVFIKFSQP